MTSADKEYIRIVVEKIIYGSVKFGIKDWFCNLVSMSFGLVWQKRDFAVING